MLAMIGPGVYRRYSTEFESLCMKNGARRVGHHPCTGPGARLVGYRIQGLTAKHVGTALQKTCWYPKIGRGQAIYGESRQAR